jgi:hypothetical protein
MIAGLYPARSEDEQISVRAARHLTLSATRGSPRKRRPTSGLWRDPPDLSGVIGQLKNPASGVPPPV